MFGFGKQESRKFIDLLLQSTNNKWANIDADRKIRVGDFGVIERATGAFLVDGNLYEHNLTRQIMEGYPPDTNPPMRLEKYTSQGVREQAVFANVSTGLASVAEVSNEYRWEFGRDRGAVLVLYSSQAKSLSRIPSEFFHDDELYQLLKDKAICTDVVSCPAFCLYLSNSKQDTFSISINANLPIPVTPGVTAGGGGGISWNIRKSQGTLKEGVDPQGNHVYFPLYSLKKLGRKSVKSVFRGNRSVPTEDGFLLDVKAPWGELNNEGKEKNDKEEGEDDDDDDDFPVDCGEPLEDFES